MNFYNNFNEMFNANTTKQDMSVFNVSLEDVKQLVYSDFSKNKIHNIYDDLYSDSDIGLDEDFDFDEYLLKAVDAPPDIISSELLKEIISTNVDDYFSDLYDEQAQDTFRARLGKGLPHLIYYRVIDKNTINEDIQLLSEIGIDVNTKWLNEEAEQYKQRLLSEQDMWGDDLWRIYDKCYRKCNGDWDKTHEAFFEACREWETPTPNYIQKTTYSSLINYLHKTYREEMKNEVYNEIYDNLTRYGNNEIV